MRVKPKVNKVATGTKLYFCPVCPKGHLISKGQKRCENCGASFDWKGAK